MFLLKFEGKYHTDCVRDSDVNGMILFCFNFSNCSSSLLFWEFFNFSINFVFVSFEQIFNFLYLFFKSSFWISSRKGTLVISTFFNGPLYSWNVKHDLDFSFVFCITGAAIVSDRILCSINNWRLDRERILFFKISCV